MDHALADPDKNSVTGAVRKNKPAGSGRCAIKRRNRRPASLGLCSTTAPRIALARSCLLPPDPAKPLPRRGLPALPLAPSESQCEFHKSRVPPKRPSSCLVRGIASEQAVFHARFEKARDIGVTAMDYPAGPQAGCLPGSLESRSNHFRRTVWARVSRERDN